MKRYFFMAMASLALSQPIHAQTAQVQFGRYGECHSGRGICAISSEAARQEHNATLIKEDGVIVLRIHTEFLDSKAKSQLTETIITSPAGFIRIDTAFSFNEGVKNLLDGLGSQLSGLSARNYPITLEQGQVNIYLTKI
ncbi:hypothetical protein [Gilvibacter sp.]|uniref:hypothetical protein n=1 Tax=Gilvibacter sp. TaxID=2729997 RepID=UPI0025BC96D0|nr:hypothetical protein [Gilvibacter sp.]NQX76234.1 hypothetical protein [Gilvibacter sp.]